ncbi:3D-(3,5/4)-trihydroxycyclohexane-1,2-dione acylhydrolase (decyclizing) [Sphingobium sp.]|uniref:3D-(3,5/4)-trihydroxycyclohexane-1,2-dione acylhydrolase (decyclizing) n=1 Tax=Sphingobium sp. TaxID=1912891 RepID=UPI0028BD67A1|nr:3D-(3,5/4)-trihydroxycyclohexane-1,2-dione acylhydrolase (decyclizing) [Sphingobium sp.]
MTRISLTAAQAVIRYLANQFVDSTDGPVRYFAGAWAIFGHGNVTGIGEALASAGDSLPTYRAHNEQAMAHAAIAYGKQMRRRRAMICTTSIGPGATNMVTAAALAHVNRLPVLFLPGDVFASRRPDPVLQQVESFADGTVSANDCFRPVSRYFDRIARPEQLIDALPHAMATLTDPASCGPVTLALCQDVQTEAFDWPESLFRPRHWTIRAPMPEPDDMDRLEGLLRAADRPLIIAGGGVAYAEADDALAAFAAATGIPVCETQAGKGSLVWDHPSNLGGVGVTGTSAANQAAAEADLIIGIGTRLQDFTTGSRALFACPESSLVQVNVAPYDAHKQDALPIVADAGRVLTALAERLRGWQAPTPWRAQSRDAMALWNRDWEAASEADPASLPSDAQAIGALWRKTGDDALVVAAAGGLPGELHKLWRVRRNGGYHVEYGYSCMGYEIAGGLGAKLAEPGRNVFVLVGDGSYLMMNSELATSVMLGVKLVVLLLDNRGFGCINRLQQASGGAAFNNLLADSRHTTLPSIDFAAHAASLGATAERVDGIAGLEQALDRAAASDRSYVIVLETDPAISTQAGGAWWDVPVAEVSETAEVRAARKAYEARRARNSE